MKFLKGPDELFGALVTMGGDPFIIETSEQAQSVFVVLSVSCIEKIKITSTDLEKLDLSRVNNVKALYRFTCKAGSALMCFAGDWQI